MSHIFHEIRAVYRFWQFIWKILVYPMMQSKIWIADETFLNAIVFRIPLFPSTPIASLLYVCLLYGGDLLSIGNRLCQPIHWVGNLGNCWDSGNIMFASFYSSVCHVTQTLFSWPQFRSKTRKWKVGWSVTQLSWKENVK